jgi:hypothetical protein
MAPALTETYITNNRDCDPSIRRRRQRAVPIQR